MPSVLILTLGFLGLRALHRPYEVVASGSTVTTLGSRVKIAGVCMAEGNTPRCWDIRGRSDPKLTKLADQTLGRIDHWTVPKGEQLRFVVTEAAKLDDAATEPWWQLPGRTGDIARLDRQVVMYPIQLPSHLKSVDMSAIVSKRVPVQGDTRLREGATYKVGKGGVRVVTFRKATHAEESHFMRNVAGWNGANMTMVVDFQTWGFPRDVFVGLGSDAAGSVFVPDQTASLSLITHIRNNPVSFVLPTQEGLLRYYLNEITLRRERPNLQVSLKRLVKFENVPLRPRPN